MTKNEVLTTEIIYEPAQASSSLYQLPDFEMPVPENRGSTVRNLQAFQVDNFTEKILIFFVRSSEHIAMLYFSVLWMMNNTVEQLASKRITRPGVTICLHEMRLSVPWRNNFGRDLNNLPRGQRQLLLTAGDQQISTHSDQDCNKRHRPPVSEPAQTIKQN